MRDVVNKIQMRQSNMECLRILAMFLLVLSHIPSYIDYPIYDSLLLTSQDFVLRIFRAFGRVGTNVFVLLTGYFSIKSCFKLSSLLKLWGITLFYSILFFILYKVILNEEIHINEILYYLFPLSFGKYWFVSCYFCLYLFSPFLIKGINSLNQKQHLLLLCVLFIWWSFLPTLIVYPQYPEGYNYNIFTWFIILFIAGSYLRLYVNPNKINFDKCIIAIWISLFVYIFHYITVDTFVFNSFLYLERNNFFIVIISVSLFLIFLKMNTTSNKIINSISVCMIGVYLIHCHPLILISAPKYLILPKEHPYFILQVFLLAVMVFFFSICIEFLRRKLAQPLVQIMVDYMQQYDNKIKQLIQTEESK